tara:strand:- start:182 stop:478 length:297 start_codon:yes stop_codon:yes gene_type:complete
MKGWNGWSPLKQKPKSRKGNVYVGDKQFSDKPMYKGHKPSTHLMADDDKLTAWPTLFQTDGVWHEGGYDEAKKRGEIYKFNTREEMINFARKGSWKNK